MKARRPVLGVTATFGAAALPAVALAGCGLLAPAAGPGASPSPPR